MFYKPMPLFCIKDVQTKLCKTKYLKLKMICMCLSAKYLNNNSVFTKDSTEPNDSKLQNTTNTFIFV